MKIDDKLAKALEPLASAAQVDVGKEVIHLAATLLPLSSIFDKWISGLAQRRLVERIVEVFQEVKSELDDLEEASVRKDYFLSDEFQTLMTLVLQEIQTTHDRTKLRMLAAALSNSCRAEFQTETRKELFVRTLRGLSPEHIHMLHSLAPRNIIQDELSNRKAELLLRKLVTADGLTLEDMSYWAPDKLLNAFPLKAFPFVEAPRGERLLLLQNLAASGLVEETLGPQRHPAREKLDRSRPRIGLPVRAPEFPRRCFRLSTFGEQFLDFVSTGKL